MKFKNICGRLPLIMIHTANDEFDFEEDVPVEGDESAEGNTDAFREELTKKGKTSCRRCSERTGSLSIGSTSSEDAWRTLAPKSSADDVPEIASTTLARDCAHKPMSMGSSKGQYARRPRDGEGSSGSVEHCRASR